MRERGYKDVTDPEELKRKLSQWQARQLQLQGRKNKLDNLTAKIDKQLKRTCTYVENIGHALSLYKTYSSSWYTQSRDFSQLTFLKDFVSSQDEKPPSKGNCINFQSRDMHSALIFAFRDIEVETNEVKFEVGSTARRRDEDDDDNCAQAVVDIGYQQAIPVWKGIKYYTCVRVQRALRQLGTIVPDLELLTVFGNRQLPKLLDKLSTIEDEKWPLKADRYSDPMSAPKRFFVNPDTGRWCQILIMEE